jgi:hypothetical protein
MLKDRRRVVQREHVITRLLKSFEHREPPWGTTLHENQIGLEWQP